MTEGVTIEPLAPDEFSIVAQWLSQPENHKWLSSEWRNPSINPSVVAMGIRNKKNRLYLARYHEQPCALVALADLDLADRIAMVWYVLGNKRAAGHGITSSAVRLLLDVAFNELQLESVHAWVMDDNIASRRVLEKAGFRLAGRLRAAGSHDNQQVDRIYFDKLRSDTE